MKQHILHFVFVKTSSLKYFHNFDRHLGSPYHRRFRVSRGGESYCRVLVPFPSLSYCMLFVHYQKLTSNILNRRWSALILPKFPTEVAPIPYASANGEKIMKVSLNALSKRAPGVKLGEIGGWLVPRDDAYRQMCQQAGNCHHGDMGWPLSCSTNFHWLRASISITVVTLCSSVT